ncbi:glycosyltransferase 87 family protein [Amycolatopsis aidingensis]|uniref:glycosyltransferase 87 family protein n=1 Tax=Amycolatopsis aidingensis TaxID=2842453 RepID=UPI001C0BA641|nr:glycosyltransferase 87 family protein [Amycolatopsis aidingensis]
MRFRWGRWLLLAIAAAGCVISGLSCYLENIPGGVDTAVYRAGAETLLHGLSLYDSDIVPFTPGYARLPFTYSPFAALAFVPLVAVPEQIGWALLNVVSVLAVVLVAYLVLRRAPRRPSWLQPGWGAVLLGLALLGLQPVWSTMGYGQINSVLMALIVLDLLVVCGATGRLRHGGGVLVGLAAATKLTPLIFVVHLALTGRRADAARAAATFLGSQGLMLLLIPHDTIRFWTHTVFDSSRIGPTALVWNQSLGAVVRRLTEDASWSQYVGYGIGAVLAVGAVVLVRRYHRGGRPVHALLVTGYLALLISPVSWVHHWVWAVPLVVLLVAEAGCGNRAAAWLLPVTLTVFVLRPMHVPVTGPEAAAALNPLTFVLSNTYVLFPVLLGLLLLVHGKRGRTPPEPPGAEQRPPVTPALTPAR